MIDWITIRLYGDLLFHSGLDNAISFGFVLEKKINKNKNINTGNLDGSEKLKTVFLYPEKGSICRRFKEGSFLQKSYIGREFVHIEIHLGRLGPMRFFQPGSTQIPSHIQKSAFSFWGARIWNFTIPCDILNLDEKTNTEKSFVWRPSYENLEICFFWQKKKLFMDEPSGSTYVHVSLFPAFLLTPIFQAQK